MTPVAPSPPTSRRLVRIARACALGAVCASACTSRPDLGPSVGSTTRQTITFSESGVATRDLEIAIAVSGSGPEHHIALDGVTIPGWSIDAIDFVASDWPIVVEGEEDKVVRIIHVRASASFSDGAVHEIVPPTVDLRGDEESIALISGFSEQNETFDPCTNLTVDAIAAQLGLTVISAATTTPGAILQPIDVAANADGAWILGFTNANAVLRLVRVKDGSAFLPKELRGSFGALAGGAAGSVVVSIQGDFENQIVRYDGDASKSWSHSITGSSEPPTAMAVAGGRVLVDVHGGFVSVDHVTLPASSSGGTRIVFDEVTGDVITSVDTPVSVGMLGLSDGAFAVAAEGKAMVLEADLTPRWSVDNPVFTIPVRFAEHGNKLWVVGGPMAVPLDVATGGAAGTPVTIGSDGTLAPLPDGTLLIGATFGSLGRVAPDGTITFMKIDAPAPWCAPNAAGFPASFPGGGAFAVSFAHADPTLPGFDKPLPALVGIVTP